MAVAEGSANAEAGGFNPMNLILLAAFALLIFMMFRGRQKQKKAQADLQSKMQDGARIMTNFGLFGTVVEQKPEENQIVLEIAPGTNVTVHSGAVARVVDANDEPAEPVEEHVADDAAPSTEETPEETMRRLNDEGKN
ncbi:protein translocase subunit yajC [Zhihengliuella halotolerans]|uniref:Protein translocase subunit yajC n=2 Tax=Zhihengliuella halotolerans TaxID=370736 RepID=A0A4Q8ABF2_9MICC|nr:protein translocase subunit yajC [Zhihengliuella halotolerans]